MGQMAMVTEDRWKIHPEPTAQPEGIVFACIRPADYAILVKYYELGS